MVAATPVPSRYAARKLKMAAQTTATPGRQHPGGNDGRDGVGGVVKTVDVIENQREAYDEDNQIERIHCGSVVLD